MGSFFCLAVSPSKGGPFHLYKIVVDFKLKNYKNEVFALSLIWQ